MPLKKGKNQSNAAFGEGFELSPEVIWKLYTLAEDLPVPSHPRNTLPPGVFTGRDHRTTAPELLPGNGILLLPKLDFKTFPYLLFIVGNELTVSNETSREKGKITFPFLSYFDQKKLLYNTHVKCGIFTSLNVTLTPSLQRKRFRCNFKNRYS